MAFATTECNGVGNYPDCTSRRCGSGGAPCVREGHEPQEVVNMRSFMLYGHDSEEMTRKCRLKPRMPAPAKKRLVLKSRQFLTGKLMDSKSSETPARSKERSLQAHRREKSEAESRCSDVRTPLVTRLRFLSALNVSKAAYPLKGYRLEGVYE